MTSFKELRCWPGSGAIGNLRAGGAVEGHSSENQSGLRIVNAWWSSDTFFQSWMMSKVDPRSIEPHQWLPRVEVWTAGSQGDSGYVPWVDSSGEWVHMHSQNSPSVLLKQVLAVCQLSFAKAASKSKNRLSRCPCGCCSPEA